MATTTIVESKTVKTKQSVYKDSNGKDFVPPNYSMNDILNAIPSKCFKRSTLRSLSYVLRDLVIIAALGYLASHIQLLPALWMRIVSWTAYSIIQGMVFTGVWVLAHECGHRAFSPSRQINDVVGWVLHSALLVPFHAWRLSHSKHHKATGNLQKDMVFVPKTKSQYLKAKGKALHELTEETPISTLLHVLVQQLFGWPAYLLVDATGHAWPKGTSMWKRNHFLPQSVLFEPKDSYAILVSDLGLLIAGYLIYLACQTFGVVNVILYYGIPYLGVNHWLVCITYLQHTDPTLPHYENGVWNFPRGASATIDRDFGFIGRHVFHRIIETHVAHHFCSRIPFYHAEEATEAIKKVMGEHYKFDGTNLLVALYKNMATCNYVDDEGDVRFFKTVKK